ncbi:MAG TPA: DUF2283 domain-containing protein [Candidatus Limnocylindrales bacterium]
MALDRRLADSLSLTYDAVTDVAYLALRSTGPADELGPTLLLMERDPGFGGNVALDFALADGRVVGFEFARASACLPAELIAGANRIDGRHLERISEMRLGRHGSARVRSLTRSQRGEA